jgi:transposase InsO family protein
MPVAHLVRRLGIPSSTWYYWRACELGGRPAKRWPTPVLDAIEESAAELAGRYTAWGHRKIWAMLRADGVKVSCSSVARAMKRRELLLPTRYLKERRAFAEARKAAFAATPVRRNRVWQMDFTEFETTWGGTWRICCVVDYATKYVLAAQISATAKARDAVNALRAAICRAEALLCHNLVGDCVDLDTGMVTRLRVVTDNGAAFKSDSFWRYIASQPQLEHIRTRHYAPGTNGVVERFHRSLKYEHLYQRKIANAAELAEEVREFLQTFNEVRPHETLGQRPPLLLHRDDPHLFAALTLQEP